MITLLKKNKTGIYTISTFSHLSKIPPWKQDLLKMSKKKKKELGKFIFLCSVTGDFFLELLSPKFQFFLNFPPRIRSIADFCDLAFGVINMTPNGTKRNKIFNNNI